MSVAPPVTAIPVTAIVDFADRAGTAPVRRIFRAPSSILCARTHADVVPTLDAVEQLARAGRWVVGFVAYEAAPAFDSAFAVSPSDSLPLAWFATFATAETGVAPHHVSLPGADPCALDPTALASEVSDREHAERIAAVHAFIEAGDVYQVNLTVPFSTTLGCAPVDTYERMRLAQSGHFAAYVDIGDAQILSASPELFFERDGGVVRSRPMKGTSRRALHAAADDSARAALLASEKERAENVMIVDVVRNDLGRLARAGGVHAPVLCETERYPKVWQLTSTVTADVEREVPLSELFRALFPPASVTGAPKIRACGIIAELEGAPRGVYCGAVGVIRPGGDATFNVAIRTATARDGVLRLHAGGGVTIDSTPTGELAEVRDKVVAFTVPRPRPTLFETIRVEHGTPMRLARHLARLAASAEYFALPCDAARAESLACAAAAAWEADVGRMRLVLQPDGHLEARVEPFENRVYDARGDSATRPTAAMVAFAAARVDRGDLWLHHKTSFRRTYDEAARAAPDAFDVILWNREGEATELTRGNLVVELDDERCTPPLDCGLLAGTFRAELLERGLVRERVVRLEELSRARRLWFVNALRGWIPIRLASAPPAVAG
jgi:para-aminobenzoate synthetase/4-amino-4-deoxychorismate lyase